MANVAAKIASTGNERILLCERGASFGYNTLVTDFRALADHGAHRLPGGVRRDPFGAAAGRAGRRRRAASASSRPVLARAAVAVGVAAVFIESHPDPDRAPCDGATMLPLREMRGVVAQLKVFDGLAKGASPTGDRRLR